MIHNAYFDHLTPGEQRRFLQYRRRMEVSVSVYGTQHSVTRHYAGLIDKLVCTAMRRQMPRKAVG